MLREYAGLTTKREVLKAEMHGITHHPVRCKKELRLCIELALTQQLVLRISARDSSARCALAMCSLFQCADHAVHLVLQRGHVMNQPAMARMSTSARSSTFQGVTRRRKYDTHFAWVRERRAPAVRRVT
eukprot:6196959-Pleurochrysis_carterae.AAC.1